MDLRRRKDDSTSCRGLIEACVEASDLHHVKSRGHFCQDQLRITPTKISDSSPPASARIACYGTAFLADASVDAEDFGRGIAPDVPQFSSPRMDASFFINCGRFLSGGLATMKSVPSAYVKRVAGTDFRSPKAAVFYAWTIESLLGFSKSATHGGHLVAIGIAHVGRIEVPPVLRPQPRSTVAHASVGERSRVKVIDRFP
jgi:hypothetical protein